MPQQMGNPPQLTPLEEILFKAWSNMHGVQDAEDPTRVAQLQGEYKASGGQGAPSPGLMKEPVPPEGPSIVHTLMRKEGEPSQSKVTMKHPNPTPEDIDKIMQMIHGGVVSGPNAVEELKLDPSRIPQNPMQGDQYLPMEAKHGPFIGEQDIDPRLLKTLVGDPDHESEVNGMFERDMRGGKSFFDR